MGEPWSMLLDSPVFVVEAGVLLRSDGSVT